ncbi:hypothetical protein GTQ41_16810 [Pseudomonas sp. AN-B15]|uniref:hypothetical protein n=1 Tax=Pseudomonas sp. AN-B15 TaxID=2697023 RepID=UPI001C2C0F46|nr:hypothetical protein [Pseudomonas sp. AN-B15]QXE10651.1 hypothetical protein GTQ41_16810 [Pseudomonas sp. AN-B15]
MTNKAKDLEELAAWDIYFAAAMPLVKAEIISQPTHNYFKRWAEKAADIADDMLVIRRQREPREK